MFDRNSIKIIGSYPKPSALTSCFENQAQTSIIKFADRLVKTSIRRRKDEESFPRRSGIDSKTFGVLVEPFGDRKTNASHEWLGQVRVARRKFEQ